MIPTEIQFPDPLFNRLKEIADEQQWSLSEVMRKAAEQFVVRFPSRPDKQEGWQMPTLSCGGDFLVDPASLSCEAEAIEDRNET
ncbi:MAG: hypothetical protein JNM18_04840 [Planctomycetaceae bacterium]|nr:hypothetical protein [Planctomycetaceae bacterium]